ncbi:MAG: S8 family serine peptidase [Actinobacteria bacterium]|nr:S8 family serine peptidase [Actinomycetota bacterium]
MSTISLDLKTTGVAEVIVILDESGDGQLAANSLAVRKLRKHFGGSELSQESAIIEDGFVDAVSPSREPSARPPRSATRKRRSESPTREGMRFYPNLGIAYGSVDREGLAALRKEPQVVTVSGAPQLRLIRPTKKVKASLTRRVAWGIDALGIPELWDQGLTGKDIVVAHLDTGVDGRHPQLQAAIGAFVEVDRLGTVIDTHPTAFDTDDHGTHTAGTIAGRPQRNTNKCIGVAPDAMLASAVVIEGGRTIARVLAGMDWALGEGARILSMSLGFPGYVEDFLPITRVLRRKGMLPIIAVGNEGPGTSRSPGNYTDALSIGWANRDETVDPDSSSQRFRRRTQPVVPDLVGPGGDIVSARPGGGFQLMSGTSMATPHIAGLAALLLQAKPEATVTQLERAILSSCQLLPGVPGNRQGRGFPNGARALARIQLR